MLTREHREAHALDPAHSCLVGCLKQIFSQAFGGVLLTLLLDSTARGCTETETALHPRYEIALRYAERDGHAHDGANGRSRERWEHRYERHLRHGAGLALVKAVALVERSEDLAVGAQVEAGNSKSSPADKARRRQRDRLIEDGH